MPSSYPGALDSFTNPTDTDTLDDPPHDEQHTDANDAIEAVQAELGLNPRGAFATVRARLDDIDDVLSNLVIARLEAGTVAIGTSATTIISTTITIPAGWSGYDLEFHYSGGASDTSGGSTGAGESLTYQAQAGGVNKGRAVAYELMDLNYHDNHPFAMHSFVVGETATGVITVRMQCTRGGAFTVSAVSQSLIVKAYRTA